MGGREGRREGSREAGKRVQREGDQKKKNLLLISGWLVLSLYTPIFQYFTIKKITFTVNTLCIEILI
jgi:hypothetical protein